MLAVFERWKDEQGCTNATEQAIEFYSMTGEWADEIPDTDPLPKEEDFYLLAALKLGNPDSAGWIKTNAKEFYEMWDEWCGKGYNGAAVLIRYMLWYERDRPKD